MSSFSRELPDSPEEVASIRYSVFNSSMSEPICKDSATTRGGGHAQISQEPPTINLFRMPGCLLRGNGRSMGSAGGPNTSSGSHESGNCRDQNESLLQHRPLRSALSTLGMTVSNEPRAADSSCSILC